MKSRKKPENVESGWLRLCPLRV